FWSGHDRQECGALRVRPSQRNAPDHSRKCPFERASDTPHGREPCAGAYDLRAAKTVPLIPPSLPPIRESCLPLPQRILDNSLALPTFVAVNGQPAKGVALYRARTVNLTPTPAPGNAISDVMRNGAIDQMFEILSGDGTTPIGT